MHPNPNELHPISASSRTAFLKNIIKNPNIIVGDYTYNILAIMNGDKAALEGLLWLSLI